MNDLKFPVVEIFDSIDGEGKRTGQLATFIRLAGCNIRCSYCDTLYALKTEDGRLMSLEEILSKVQSIGNKNITLTGGEPLSVKNVSVLIFKLAEDGYDVNIETNGTLNIEPYLNNKNVFVTMDYKTISSGMNKQMLLSNIKALRRNDILKIVCSEEDFADIKDMLRREKPTAKVYFSPVFGKIKPLRLVDFIKELRNDGEDTGNMQVQIQLHKIIWSPDERGV